jgi:hypothetical protein
MYYILSAHFPPGSLVYQVHQHPWILMMAGDFREFGTASFFLLPDLKPHGNSFALSPQELLDFRPLREIGGRRHPPPPGEKPWFENACKTAGCHWLLPLVQAMAEGSTTGPDEILKAYAAHNGGIPPERYR